MALPVSGSCIKSEYNGTSLSDTYYAYRPSQNNYNVDIKIEKEYGMVYSEAMAIKAEPVTNEGDIDTAQMENIVNGHMKSDNFSQESSSAMPCNQFLLFQQALDTLKTGESDTDENYVNTSDEDVGADDGCSDVNPSDDTGVDTNVADDHHISTSHTVIMGEGIEQRNVNTNLNKGLKTMLSVKENKSGSPKDFDTQYTKELHGNVNERKINKGRKDMNRNRDFRCEICFKMFESNYHLKRHCKIHRQERHVCSICNAVFRRKCYMENHYKNKHEGQQNTMTCSECSKTFISYQGYNQHMDSHKGVRYPCEVCGKDFSAKQTLKIHMKLHQNGDTHESTLYHTCDVCQKMFATKTNLALHMQIHLGTQMYSCHVCDAHFSRAADLNRHITIHTGEKPYKCKQCPKAFRSPGDLGRHERSHNGYQTCKYCNKSYVRLDEFMRHLATHAKPDLDPFDNKDIFFCNLCKSAFTSELTFKNHMKRKHPDVEEPTSVNSAYTVSTNVLTKARKIHLNLPCTECSEVFANDSSRKRHMQRKHATPYTLIGCDTCAKKFGTKYDLKVHIQRNHLEQMPHPCSNCEASFSEKRYLKKHMKRAHQQNC